MTALDVFHHGSWELRTLLIDGEPWFVAADVCAALGYSNGRKAVADHVDDLDRGVTASDTPGGRQNVTVINESGLYALIFGSRLETARAFKRWVTGEVLPTLRRTGAYTVEPAVKAPTTMVEALELALQQARQIVALEEQVAVLEPAARFADTLADAHGDWSVREAAQILDRDPTISTGERRLFATLRAIGWIDRTNQPYQGQINTGRLVCRLGHYRDERTDELVAYSQVRVTPKGLRALHERLGGTGALVAPNPTGGAR